MNTDGGIVGPHSSTNDGVSMITGCITRNTIVGHPGHETMGRVLDH